MNTKISSKDLSRTRTICSRGLRIDAIVAKRTGGYTLLFPNIPSDFPLQEISVITYEPEYFQPYFV